jgi:dTDP-4-amino-4,6-dideoxygalactose transaminase
LEGLDAHLARRRDIAARYRAGLESLAGVRLQQIEAGDESTWKDCTIVVDPEAFGLDRTALASVLEAEGVQTRRYFHPPVHRQRSYEHEPRVDLPVTDALGDQVLSLPIYPGLADADIECIIEVIGAAHEHAPAVLQAVSS